MNKPIVAMGIDNGMSGWKKSAVRIRFPRFAKIFAMSKSGPSKSL
jgi:hypothetical protein